MAQFEGSKLKVRCTDCTKLSGSHCIAKNTKVSPKKKRLCGQYNFKGEYENRTPAEAMYMPHIDKKTQRMIKKLLKMGVVPVAEDGSIDTRDGFARTKILSMPASTATAALLGTKIQEDHKIADPNIILEPEESSDESEFNRS